MKITLYVNNILYDLKTKNLNETSGIADAEQRYRAQAGSEKDDELKRDILNAAALLSSTMMRFLAHTFSTEADNSAYLGDAIVYDFAPSERRQINRIPAIADLLHSFIVNMALSRFYETVALYDLAKERSRLAGEDMAALQPVMYEKLPPTIPTREDYGNEDTDNTTV